MTLLEQFDLNSCSSEEGDGGRVTSEGASKTPAEAHEDAGGATSSGSSPSQRNHDTVSCPTTPQSATQYRCDTRSRRLSHLGALEMHVDRHHNVIRCDRCGTSFKEERGLTRHLEGTSCSDPMNLKSSRRRCSCGKSYSRKDGVQRHLRRMKDRPLEHHFLEQ